MHHHLRTHPLGPGLLRLLAPLVGRPHAPAPTSIRGAMIALDDDPILFCGCDRDHTC